MLRCRIWNERSSAHVRAFCRHPTLSRQHDLGRRNYSDASNPTPQGNDKTGGWGRGHGVKPAGVAGISSVPRGPVASGGWGQPLFGAEPSSGASKADERKSPLSLSDSLDSLLLPHELAARKKLAAQQAIQPKAAKKPKPLGGLPGGLNGPRISRNPLANNFAVGAKKPLAGLEEKPLAAKDWRHRSETERPPTTKPVPHSRHFAKDEKTRYSAQQVPPKQKMGLGNSAGGETGGWGQLARKPPSNRSQDTAPDALSSPVLSKESFFSRFTEVLDTKYNQQGKEPRTSRRDLGRSSSNDFVTEEVMVENSSKPERRTRDFDESYEISRDPRRRDKAGSRRGDAYGSSRGAKKSVAQQKWENENEVWEDNGASREAERRRKKAEAKARRLAQEKAAPQNIFLPEFISISNLGTALKLKPQAFLRSLSEMGFEDITEDSIMTGETAALVAQEFGFEPTVDTGGVRDLRPRPPPEDVTVLPPRPPVVTIMGHVDHGKTTLLDYLRKSSVAAQEHGGITQHIGAFMVKMSDGKLITFLDTPGHAAFLTMRQRGANVTDIVVLVVAADDSVKPQTIEAIKHAKSANVPIIVAINKCDKEDAKPDQVKADLARHGVEIEDFGGDVQVVCVSGKTGQGMGDLEENIVTLADIQDMRAEKDGMAEAWVLEASVKQYGKSANVLVKRGTLRPGDFVVAGTAWARVRLLRNEAGQELEEAPPGMPVEVLGWRDELPAAGDEVLQAPDEDRARTAVDYREEMREREASSKQLAEQEHREREAKIAAEVAKEIETVDAEEGEIIATKVVNFMVRADVVGSVEAVCATIKEIGNNEVKPRILRSSAGQVSESDVEYAEASNSVIANFNSAIPAHVKHLAEDKGVKILDHTVIYHLSDEVKQVMSENLADKVTSKVVGEAEILQVFPINVKGRTYKNIAGCKVRNGMVTRSTNVRILRKGEKIFDGKIDTLKHGKKDVNEIRKGTECGIAFEGFTDFQAGDQIQTYEEVREKRSL
ncbi:translation initiation factor IF-2 [Colletotrichum graminicola]|uniref:Translation initiation factor IF-2, mitochondrial n=1 Tax=Colletotrichum graminicola (strain M1.001 / M2 / FGSC 10212) TaxID=645133 RepID=E3QLP6_COLGM|nr:translation initiation factor IF-2 [Colletotrichum graminicola M1.001]EFQ31784.1 translation initiation factor IF-2 [Colletotrichum graminicola M1.001]WDK13540.1 translation initiation factor IF-2 [Colletotrichum graminicola]